MTKEDWEAILEILEEIERGMWKAKQSLFPTENMENARKIAHARIRALADKD